MEAVFLENFNLFIKNLVSGRIIIEINSARVNGNKKIPSLNSKKTTNKIRAMYTIKYNFLKSKSL